MYIEIKSDDPQPIVELLTKLATDGDRAQVSLGKSGSLVFAEASINETEEEPIS